MHQTCVTFFGGFLYFLLEDLVMLFIELLASYVYNNSLMSFIK